MAIDAGPALRIGCAGWSLGRADWPSFPPDGSHLERYAARLDCVEINSSFYRPHRAATYERWCHSTPEHFRFAVKLPRSISHDGALRHSGPALDRFLAEVAGLGRKLGCLLIQLPPSQAFEARRVARFLATLRRRHRGAVALEPRHASWFQPVAERLLAAHQVARVLADPVLHAGGEHPAGHEQLIYLRLHGSPRIYWSAYPPGLLEALADRIGQALAQGSEVWCIFDNTAGGQAVGNALALQAATLQRSSANTAAAAARLPITSRPLAKRGERLAR